jgi:AMIN domain
VLAKRLHRSGPRQEAPTSTRIKTYSWLGIMKTAAYLFSLLALVPLAAAQETGGGPGPVEVSGIRVSVEAGEVRVVIATSAPPTNPGTVRVYSDSLILDLPGLAYTRSARRVIVSQKGIQDVRIWLQQQNPPLTRISIRLDGPLPYALEKRSDGFVLRVGDAVGGGAASVSNRGGKPQPSAAPAGRPSGPARAAETIAGIFRRSPKEKSAAAVPVPSQSGETPSATAPGNPPETIGETPPVPPTASRDSVAKGAAGGGIGGEASSDAVSTANKPMNAEPIEAARGEAPSVPVIATSSPSGGAKAGTEASVTPSASASAGAVDVAAPRVGGNPAVSGDVQSTQAVTRTANADLRTVFHVKYVQQDTAYIDGGKSSGLSEGMRLIVKDAMSSSNPDAPAISEVAELVVVGVAETSAVTEIHTPKRDIVPGDVAYLSSEDTQALVQQRTLGSTRKYPAVISFTEGADALDEEARAEVPRPPLPSVNRARGRIGLDYMGTQGLGGSQFASRDVGVVFRADFTRIGGTYWNLSGYWRGRINSISSGSQTTLQDLINRTYHLSLTYDNPAGHWVAGVGRLYIPWASSLETIDGGYFGRRFRPGFVVGLFAGSAPDPSSWNYNPNLRMGGVFMNLEGGSFDSFHYSSTTGVGTNLLKWQVDRPFVFFENSIEYKHNFSVYHALQADRHSGNPAVAAPAAGIGRSFLTVRWSPVRRVQVDANHTYFRDIPEFDPALVGTGLLDKYLFQGFSGGGRVEIVKQISVYTELGRSYRTGDAKSSLNEMYGISFGNVPLLALRADAHYSRFDSSFGKGSYRALAFSRSLAGGLRLDVLAGDQTFTSALAGNQNARFLTTTVDTALGAMFFLQGGFTVYRGQLQSYNQWMFTLGYRFDSKGPHR